MSPTSGIGVDSHNYLITTMDIGLIPRKVTLDDSNNYVNGTRKQVLSVGTCFLTTVTIMSKGHGSNVSNLGWLFLTIVTVI